MSETTPALSSGMRLEAARERISAFSEFGPAHHYFAQHVAFPMSLTVDLLYRLWANFQRDIHDEKLHIPWIAVSDLLLSSLCDEVGHELYEMDVTVRAELLRDLQADPRFGQQRIHELSYFLLDYVQQQVHSSNAGVRKFAEAQQWTVLAYIQPGRAARELAESLKALEQNNKTEQIRLVSVMETLNKLAPPLSALEGFTPLLTYARGIERVARGDIEGAKAQFGAVEAVEQVERTVGVQLPRYEGLLEVRQEVAQTEQTPATPATDTRKDFLISYYSADVDWANWITWQLEEAGYAIELQPWAFQPEANFVAEVDRVEKLAKHIIVLLSPDYLSALASMPAWVDAFFRDPRNGPDFMVALHVRECSTALISILGPVDYTNVVGLNEEAARAQLLARVSILPDETAMPPLFSDVISHSLTVQPDFPGTPAATTKASQAVEVFYSYSPRDERFREELDKHLSILQRQGLIVTWYGRAVDRGSESTREIDTRVNIAQIILLLVSADFLNSLYPYNIEFKRAMERHKTREAVVIPIILSDVFWEWGELKGLQALPKDGKAVTSRFWANRDEAFIDVVEGIRRAIEQFTGRSSIETEAPQETEVQRIEEGDAHANKRIAGAALLWVDDHPENNVYPRRAMEAVGIRITLSKSTEDALEKVHSYAYDVIISDMGRQPPDPQAPHDYRAGYNLLDKLRDQHIFTPFIIYAGSSSAEEQEETRRRGGFGTTNDTDVLLQMVISAIEQPASRSAAETEAVVEEVAEEAEDVVEGTGERVEDISMASERVRQAAEQVISRSAAETEAPQTVEEKWKEVGDGYASAGHYELAIAAYQTALPSYPQAAFPAEWANLQARLGDAYSMRVEGSRQDNLERAVAYYQAALQVSTRAVFPTQWAELQQKLRDASRAYEQRRMVAANLDQLIETVKSQMQPPPRAMATASTLQQLSTFIPDEVTLADLVVGWQALSHSSEEKEEPAISQRRVTCGELANMASQFTTDQGNLAQAIKAWQYWLEAFKNSGDPRQEAMAKTFDRELKELESEEFESEEPESKEL